MHIKALSAELIGTFALIFIGAGAGALGIGGLIGVAFAHGLVILALIYTLGPISGAHLNPAVTFGLLIGGEFKLKHAVVYWTAQLLGGALGAWVLCVALGGSESGLGATTLASTVTPARGILIEAILTFLLMFTIFCTAVSGRGGDQTGIAIGMILTACILMGGPLTGASLNPARTFGPALFTNGFGQFWIYVVGPFAGAAVAALSYKYIFAK